MTILIPYLFAGTLPEGEILEYQARFGFFTIGKILLENRGIEFIDGRPVYHLRMFAKGGALGINLYEDFHTWVDTATFATVKFHKVQDEPGWKYDVVIVYRNDTAYYRGTKNGKPVNLKYKVPHGAMDFVGMIYYIRKAGISPDDTIKVPYHMDGFSGTAKIFVKEIKECSWIREEKDTCYSIAPIVPVDRGKAKEVLNRGGELLVSAKHLIPVKIKVGLKVGSITGILKNIRFLE